MGFYRRGLAGLSTVGQAIGKAEGYGVAGAVPTLANNPGDLELGDIGYGTITAAGGQQITKFPSVAAGESALENQINLIATGQSRAGYTPQMTIAQVGQLYSGGSSAWANNVAAALGVSPSTNFASLTGSQPPPNTGASLVTDSGATADPSSDDSGYFSDLIPGFSADLGQGSLVSGGLVSLAALLALAWALAD